MMLRSLVALLLVFNVLVLSWTTGVFSKWGWGPAQPHPDTQAQPPIAADALKVLDIQSTTTPPAPASAPDSSSAQ